MSYVEDYGLDAPSRKWSLLALLLKDRLNRNDMDILHLQKVMRYFEYLRDTKELDFSDFKLGAVSYELEENLQTLIDCGLIEENYGKYSLTDEGKDIAKKIECDFDEKELRKLTFAKQQLNDLSSDETMYFMYKLIPSTQKNSTEYSRLERKKDLLVRGLFFKGRISSNMAAKWLGISEKDFIGLLPKRN